MNDQQVLAIATEILEKRILGDTRLIGICYHDNCKGFVAKITGATKKSNKHADRRLVMEDEGFCLTSMERDDYITTVDKLVNYIQEGIITIISNEHYTRVVI
jgi:hypothetical protein